jgi:hypothetical protein
MSVRSFCCFVLMPTNAQNPSSHRERQKIPNCFVRQGRVLGKKGQPKICQCLVETLGSGSHLRRGPRVVLLLELGVYLAKCGHWRGRGFLFTQTCRPVQESTYEDLSLSLQSVSS